MSQRKRPAAQQSVLPQPLAIVRHFQKENPRDRPDVILDKVCFFLRSDAMERLGVNSEAVAVPDEWWHRFEKNKAWVQWLREVGVAIGCFDDDDARWNGPPGDVVMQARFDIHEFVQRRLNALHRKLTTPVCSFACLHAKERVAAAFKGVKLEQGCGTRRVSVAPHPCSRGTQCLAPGLSGFAHFTCFASIFPKVRVRRPKPHSSLRLLMLCFSTRVWKAR